VTGQLISDSNFRRRVITAVIGMPLVIAVVVLGYPVWTVVVILVGLVCVRELWKMICPTNQIALIGMIAVLLSCFLSYAWSNYLFLGLAAALVWAAELVQMMGAGDGDVRTFRRGVVYPVLGALYVGIPLSLMLAIRGLDQGLAWTAMFFATNWSTDSFALIGGRLAGRTKLAPQISPGKTREGAAIGFILGSAIGFLVSLVVGLPGVPSLVGSVAVAFLTIIGDLLESWIKRVFSVKDSGSLLPGHGGFLDRVDGMLLAVPALFIILHTIT